MHASDEKSFLRHSIEERLTHLSVREKDAESRSLCHQLLPHIPAESLVCAYYPMNSEADIRPLLEELLHRRDRVYLPCFENGTLVFRKFENQEHVRKGMLGVMEPQKHAPELIEKPDIVLVPGRAFDRKGNRMGRGNGGYDRWIRKQRKEHPGTRFIGVALECQLVDAVPMDAHDEPVDAVVTARGLVETNRK